MMQLFLPHSLLRNDLIKLPSAISGITSYAHSKAFRSEIYFKLPNLYEEDYKCDGSYFYDLIISRSDERNSFWCAEKLPGAGDELVVAGFSAHLL